MNKVGNKNRAFEDKAPRSVRRSFGEFMPRNPNPPPPSSKPNPSIARSSVRTGNKNSLLRDIKSLLNMLGFPILIVAASVGFIYLIPYILEFALLVLKAVFSLVVILMVINKPNLFK